jgi:hypothetical protein
VDPNDPGTRHRTTGVSCQACATPSGVQDPDSRPTRGGRTRRVTLQLASRQLPDLRPLIDRFDWWCAGQGCGQWMSSRATRRSNCSGYRWEKEGCSPTRQAWAPCHEIARRPATAGSVCYERVGR